MDEVIQRLATVTCEEIYTHEPTVEEMESEKTS